MTKNCLKVLLPAMMGLLILAESSSAQAQYGYGYGAPPPRPQMGFRHRPHFYFGGQLMGLAVLKQSTDYASGYLGQGGGGGLFGGFRFGPFFSLEANWNVTYHNIYDQTYWTDDYWGYQAWSFFWLQEVTIDAKVHIPTYGPVEPFFQAGVGLAFVGVGWDSNYGDSGDVLFASGPAFNLGGGLDFWLSPFFSMGGRVLYRGMRFGEPTYDAKSGKSKYANFVNAVSLDVNATMHF
jgi:hypothetical protein